MEQKHHENSSVYGAFGEKDREIHKMEEEISYLKRHTEMEMGLLKDEN